MQSDQQTKLDVTAPVNCGADVFVQMHNAPKQSLKSGYPDSYSDKFNNWVGMELGPSVDFSMLAASCRAYGETVSDPSQVVVVLEIALEEVRKGRAAVVDVRIERPQ